MSLTVALVKWGLNDELSDAISQILSSLGYRVVPFIYSNGLPPDADIVFTFAPYEHWYPIVQRVQAIPTEKRPVFLHWNTENPPNLRIPWAFLLPAAYVRFGLDRLLTLPNPTLARLLKQPAVAGLVNKLHRLRYLGTYHYAIRSGLLDLLFDTSQVFVSFYRKHHIPAEYAPWGVIPDWCADLHLERDIDVLWMGKRRTARRSRMIENLRAALAAENFTCYVADGNEHPFIYGEERKRMLNRTKITVNILAASHYDNILPFRFALAAANGSMVVAEPELRHCNLLIPGVHYAAAPAEQFTNTVLYYLKHDTERCAIADRARCLTQNEFRLQNSLASIMARAEEVYKQRHSP